MERKERGPVWAPFLCCFFSHWEFFSLTEERLLIHQTQSNAIFIIYVDAFFYHPRVGVYGASAVIYSIEILDGGVAKRNRFVVE